MTFWVALIVCTIVLPTNWAGGTFVQSQLDNQKDLEVKGYKLSDCEDNNQSAEEKGISDVCYTAAWVCCCASCHG
jgi:hypothetical protein